MTVSASPAVTYTLTGLFVAVWLLMGLIAGTIEESPKSGRRVLHALLGPLAVLVFVIPGVISFRRTPAERR